MTAESSTSLSVVVLLAILLGGPCKKQRLALGQLPQAPAVVAFDTVMPNGKTAHGGILSSDGRGGQHVVFHFREPRGS